jgi:flagellar biosynthesis/type III secretory pathway protein FliH
VVEEEKNSSRERLGNARPGRLKSFKLHYFPEIPLDGKSAGEARRGAQNGFHPSGFAAEKTADAAMNCRQAESNPPTDRTAGAARSLPDVEAEAYLKGYRRGEKSGLEEAGQRIEAALSALSEAVRELRRLEEKRRCGMDKEIIELALAVARKVIGHEVSEHREILQHIIREALSRVDEQKEIVVKVHPDDFAMIEHQSDTLFNLSERAIRFQPDPAVSGGGCLIETECGDIDARIDRQLAVIEEALRSDGVPAPAAGPKPQSS